MIPIWFRGSKKRGRHNLSKTKTKHIKLVRVTTVNRSLNKLLEGQLAYMSQFFDVLGVSSPDETTAELVQREQVAIRSIQMTRTISPAKDLLAIWKMYHLFREVRPEIVHSHTPKAGLVAMSAAWLARVPVRMHTIAGLPLETTVGVKKWVLTFVEKLTYAMSTMTYPNSYGVKEYVLKNKLAPKSKIKVVGKGSSNGIDLDYFRKDPQLISASDTIREELHIERTDKVFLFVGRLVVDKGIVPLIAAWTIFQREFPLSKLLLVGGAEKELSPLPHQTLAVIDQDKSIMAVGHKADVRPYFCAADYFVFPSFREGLPNVLLQAGAMELPMIVTAINGNTDIVKDGVNGIVVPPNNADELYKAMRMFATNKSMTDQLKKKSRKIISDRYCRRAFRETLLSEYYSQLSKAQILKSAK